MLIVIDITSIFMIRVCLLIGCKEFLWSLSLGGGDSSTICKSASGYEGRGKVDRLTINNGDSLGIDLEESSHEVR